VSDRPQLALAGVTTLLCDADGTLFPSEEPAFVASAAITRRIAERYGLTGDFSPEGLRSASTGRNFRDTTAQRLAEAGIAISPDELEQWVQRENDAVTERLAEALVVETDVVRAVKQLEARYRLALVSSSALRRLDACLDVTGLADYFPSRLRFSAEDSLDHPVSKPDPAVYRLALERLGCQPGEAIAIEDSVSGTRSAVGAGLVTLGIVQFAPPGERRSLRDRLHDAGATAVADDWAELEGWL
jgi:HAD superfamily hydrolase (TIGR01509 family)